MHPSIDKYRKVAGGSSEKRCHRHQKVVGGSSYDYRYLHQYVRLALLSGGLSYTSSASFGRYLRYPHRHVVGSSKGCVCTFPLAGGRRLRRASRSASLSPVTARGAPGRGSACLPPQLRAAHSGPLAVLSFE